MHCFFIISSTNKTFSKLYSSLILKSGFIKPTKHISFVNSNALSIILEILFLNLMACFLFLLINSESFIPNEKNKVTANDLENKMNHNKKS